MRKCETVILVICDHHGNLIEYSRVLNQMGFFGLVLCSSEVEALVRIAGGVEFSHLIYDGFLFDARGCEALSKLCRGRQSIALLSEATGSQFSAMQRWAADRNLKIQILSRPVSINQLRGLFDIRPGFKFEGLEWEVWS